MPTDSTYNVPGDTTPTLVDICLNGGCIFAIVVFVIGLVMSLLGRFDLGPWPDLMYALAPYIVAGAIGGYAGFAFLEVGLGVLWSAMIAIVVGMIAFIPATLFIYNP